MTDLTPLEMIDALRKADKAEILRLLQANRKLLQENKKLKQQLNRLQETLSAF